MPSPPIDFQPPSSDAPPILLPVSPNLLAERADRFATLAAGHSLADWLTFLSHLSRAQHRVLQSLPPLPVPQSADLELARIHRMPPLSAGSLPRPATWRDAVRQIAADLEKTVPTAARETLAGLRGTTDDRLEQLASALLDGEPNPRDVGMLPIVAAALQAVWTALASRLDTTQVQNLDTPGICPCCGSLPVASIVRLGTAINNLRYVHCSLCNTEWNVPRATCTACGADKDIALHEISGGNGAVRAETCDSCKSYLKIVYQDKDPRVDPVADDLATLALDLLVDEAGYRRSGPNLLLLGGAG